jgi:hypothetical protein
MGIVSTSPQRILATLQAYRDAATLNTAIELDLFTRIAHGTDTPDKIAAELRVPARGVRLLCEYLAGLGVIEEEDEQLKLSADAAVFLDRKSPDFLGGTVGVLNSPSLLRAYERLTDAVRAGHCPPAVAPPKSVPNTAATDAPIPNASVRPPWFDVARGVTDLSAAARIFAETVKLPAEEPLKFLDIGARDGAFGIALAMRFPNSVVVALDAPDLLQTAQRNADAALLGTRYQNIPGDPLLAPLGTAYDAVLTAGNLNQYHASQITSLMMRIRYSLKKTGQFMIFDFLSEDSPEFLRQHVGFHLNVLAATPRGDVYSLSDVKGMLESSGFRNLEFQGIPEACATLITARA